MAQRLFGTDGVRGVAGVWPLDPPTISRLGAAVVRVRTTGAPLRIILGRDTRELEARAALALYRDVARKNAARRLAGEPTDSLAFALDPATYAS